LENVRKEKETPRRTNNRWEKCIKMDRGEVDRDGVDWPIYFCMGAYVSFVNMAMNF
jgi:hypothetical protein